MRKEFLFLVVFMFSLGFVLAAYNDSGNEVGEDVPLLLSPTSFCGGNITCNCGDTVIDSVTLQEDLVCPGFTWGLAIGTNVQNVELDCNGHEITGNDAASTVGIKLLGGSNNVTIKNCKIHDWFHGITHQDSSYVSYLNNEVFGNNQQGIYIVGVNSLNNTIQGNLIYFNNKGIALWYSPRNTLVTENIFHNNTVYGIELGSTHENIIQGNTFLNLGIQAYEDSLSTNNLWNFTTGNYWIDFDSNPGYPNNYEIPGPGLGIDFDPLNEIPPEDTDGDGYPDDVDNCPMTYNLGQTDLDGDGVGDWCDNCVATKNAGQNDNDGNGIGNKCENTYYQCRSFTEVPPPGLSPERERPSSFSDFFRMLFN